MSLAHKIRKIRWLNLLYCFGAGSFLAQINGVVEKLWPLDPELAAICVLSLIMTAVALLAEVFGAGDRGSESCH